MAENPILVILWALSKATAFLTYKPLNHDNQRVKNKFHT